MARSAALVGPLEQRVHAVPRLGQGRRFQTAVRRRLRRSRHGIRHGRRHHRQGPPPRAGRKRGTQSQAIGRSKGGMTTKILAPTDALGNLVRFELLPGHRFDTIGLPPLIAGLEFDALIADKAFDSNAIIADLDARGAKIVISQHPRRASPLPIDAEIYKVASPDRKLLLQAQGIQTHRHARRQNRPKLRRKYPSRRSRDKLPMNPNRP